MAGLLVTIGHSSCEKHDICEREIIHLKGLKVSRKIKEKYICISKLSRNISDDKNMLEKQNFKINVVGTLIFNNLTGQKALNALIDSLKINNIEDILDKIDGIFCLTIQDVDKKEFYLITDHAGILNLYLYKQNESFFISTSALALSRTLPVSPDHNGIIQFLRTANVYGTSTIHEEIQTLAPATIYKFNYSHAPHLIKTTKYWAYPTEIDEGMSRNEAQDRLGTVLKQSLSVIDSEDSVYDLTAGFDSRLILSALIASKGGDTTGIKTFVFGPQNSHEAKLVKNYCNILNLQNHHCTLPTNWNTLFAEYFEKSLKMNDGEDSCYNYAPILWAQEVKAKRYNFSVNGLGGELYRDFWWVQEIGYAKKQANITRLIDMRVLQYEFCLDIFSEKYKSFFADSKNIIKMVFDKSILDIDKNSTYNTIQIDNIYLREKIRRWAGRMISSSNQLIPTISPLLFKKCLEAGMPVPPRHKKNGKLVKGLVENFCPEFARLKMLNGAPCQNIRRDNFVQFLPLLVDKSGKIARKISQTFLHRTILLDKSLTYSAQDWFATLLATPQFKSLLTFDDMVTKVFFTRKRFKQFLADAQKPGFQYYPQLGNILTLEMRLRKDNLLDNP